MRSRASGRTRNSTFTGAAEQVSHPPFWFWLRSYDSRNWKPSKGWSTNIAFETSLIRSGLFDRLGLLTIGIVWCLFSKTPGVYHSMICSAITPRLQLRSTNRLHCSQVQSYVGQVGGSDSTELAEVLALPIPGGNQWN